MNSMRTILPISNIFGKNAEMKLRLNTPKPSSLQVEIDLEGRHVHIISKTQIYFR